MPNAIGQRISQKIFRGRMPCIDRRILWTISSMELVSKRCLTEFQRAVGSWHYYEIVRIADRKALFNSCLRMKLISYYHAIFRFPTPVLSIRSLAGMSCRKCRNYRISCMLRAAKNESQANRELRAFRWPNLTKMQKPSLPVFPRSRISYSGTQFLMDQAFPA